MTETKTHDPPLGVIDWSDAFDVCRERDRPLRVMDADGSVDLIYPSGSFKPVKGDRCDLFILPPADK